ncbi:MAG TPA: hypothetical protein VJL61_03480 [Rhodanobacteraceae bacterium]|nr:hypothetical protein [Rhodanobacteraceae bacterium]
MMGDKTRCTWVVEIRAGQREEDRAANVRVHWIHDVNTRTATQHTRASGLQP